MKNVEERKYFFDLARVICTLWIVCVYHMSHYLPKPICYFDFDARIQMITMCVLGVFFFISAFFLAKYNITSLNECKVFYRKRFFRFYFLYAIAVVWFCHHNVKACILALLGLTSFIPPQIKTLWFMSMLMSFYIITPLLIFLLKQRPIWFTLTCFLFCLFFTHFSEERLLFYFPVYCFGLYLGSHRKLVEVLLNRFDFSLICCITTVFGVFFADSNSFLKEITIFSGLFLILQISCLCSKFAFF